jgi:enterochelin esterase family protein
MIKALIVSVCRKILLLLGMVSILQAQDFNEFLQRLSAEKDSVAKSLIVNTFLKENQIPWRKDTQCVFLYKGTAQRISCTGDHLNWNSQGEMLSRIDGTDLWFLRKNFPNDARLDYKFIVGSNWILDPLNPFTCLGGFGPNSELRMPAWSEQPEYGPHTNISKGKVRDTVFSSAALGNQRTIRIYTPAGFSLQMQYPLIVFHDGLDYANIAKATEIFDYLIENKKCSPFIAVFVPAVNRKAEYAGNQINTFTDFIAKDIIGWVEKNYPIRPEARYRAVAGASDGGNISLYCAMKYPNIFGNVAAQSSNVIQSIQERFAANPPLPLKVWLDIGSFDIPVLIPLVKNLASTLEKQGYDMRYQLVNEGHSWGNWRARIDEYIQWFFPPGSTLDIPSEQTGTLQGLISRADLKIQGSQCFISFTLKQDIAALHIRLFTVDGASIGSIMRGEMAAGFYTDSVLIDRYFSNGPVFLQFIHPEQNFQTIKIMGTKQ